MVARKGFAFLAALLLVPSIETGAVEQGKTKKSQLEMWPVLMELSFVPFGAMTDVLITPANIEKTNSYAIWFLRDPITGDHPFIKTLRDLLEKTPSTIEIDNGFIRLKANLVLDQVVYHVDGKGTVKRHDGKLFHLEKGELDEIEKQIKSFAGVVDMRATKRLQSGK
jgi:hypothetical protein